jgi:hypothetical protein
MADRGLGIATIILATVLAAAGAFAEERTTERTLRLADGEARPAATLQEVGWLVGSWVGEAFGKRFEEVWNPPSAGSMVGMWKLHDGDTVSFYELMVLIEEEGSLALRVKHFDADFVAWEEREDYVSFPLVRIEEDALHFSGLSFYRRGDDRIEAWIAMKYDSGVHEEKLVFRRVDR